MRYFVILSLCFLIGFSANAQNKKSKKEQQKQEIYQVQKELINSKSYEFIASWAEPVGSSRINLITNPNYLRYTNGDIDMFFPYFGTGQTVNSYNSGDMGISYMGRVDDYHVDYNDDKREITIKFSVNSRAETFNMRIIVYGESARVIVNSSGRTTIAYTGEIHPKEEKK